MAIPTLHVTTDLTTQFPAGSLVVSRKTKVNPFAAATAGTPAGENPLPPAPPVGLVYPR